MTRVDLGPGHHLLTGGLVCDVAVSAAGRETAVLLYLPGDVLFEQPDAELKALLPCRFVTSRDGEYLRSLPQQLERARQLARLRTLMVQDAIPEMLTMLSDALQTRILRLTSEELGVCLGVTRETVDKELPALKRAGRVRRSYKEFEVLG